LITIEAVTNKLRYGRIRIRLLFESTRDNVGHSSLLKQCFVRRAWRNPRANDMFSLSDKELRAAPEAASPACR
jgi:hypothetical protein